MDFRANVLSGISYAKITLRLRRPSGNSLHPASFKIWQPAGPALHRKLRLESFYHLIWSLIRFFRATVWQGVQAPAQGCLVALHKAAATQGASGKGSGMQGSLKAWRFGFLLSLS